MNERQTSVINEMNRQMKGTSVESMRKSRGGHLRFPVYMNSALMDADIADLQLSVRSFNCLKRAGWNKVGDLVNQIERKEDLLKLRNLGKQSADEIMLQLMCYQYGLLRPEKQKEYVKRIVELNGNLE